MAAAEMAAAAEASETSVATRAAVQTSEVERAAAGRAVVGLESEPQDISAGDFPYRTYPNHRPYPLE
tara:strand:- start:392 stop:592 length:201 start_codon:yes stop_codon:yes gene_type:complete